MKRTILAVSFALLMSVPFVSGVMAESQKQAVPATSAPAITLGVFSGAIDRIDSSKKEIIVKLGNDEKSFYWSDHTKFMQGDKEKSFSDLKKGTNVTVEYNKEGTRLTAERIDIGMPKTSG